MKNAHRRRLGIAVAAFIAFAAESAHAQSATGSIDGVVVDQSRAVLHGVTIKLVQAATGVDRTVMTDEHGRFRAPVLPVGVYEVSASLTGFQTVKQDVPLTIGQAASLRFEMPVAGVVETVDVAGVPALARTRSAASTTVNELAVQNLPVNGRNFISFVLLTPGVARDVRGDLSFAGQSGTLSSLVVDGADNNHTVFGRTLGAGRAPYQFSLDVVQEFQVNANAFSAEYGRAGAGVINVVTRSGSNALRGSAFEFYRDKELNATNAINELNNQPKSPYHYHQFGGTIGGPLRRNRDFFFAGYDGQRNRLPNLVVMNLPPELPGDAATAAGLERLRPLAASWSRSLDQDVFLMKTDHQVDADHRLSVRYNHQDFTGEGYEAFGPVQSLEHSGDSIVRTRTLNVSWAAAMRNGLFNEVRVQYARDHEPGTANSDNPEANVQQGATVLFIGRNNFSPRENAIDRVQVADTLTWMRGAHMVKTGFDIQIDRIRNSFPAFYRGSYLFLSLASFSRLRPDGPGESYQQSFPGPGTSGPDTQPDLREYSLFVQDEWKIRPDFTLNLGLRYDLMRMADLPVRNPDPQLAAAGIDTSRFPADVDNLGPRLGLAWSPRRHTYVVRGGWGLFYGRTPAVMANSAALNNGVNTVSLTFTGQAVPTYPQWFTEIPTGAAAARPTIVYVDEAFANPRLMHGNVAFEWQVADRASLAVTYVHVNGSDLPRSVDRNIGAPGVRTLTIGGTGEVATVQFFADATRPFSSFRRVIAFESNAESRYNGITLELASRQTGSTQYRVAYTFGKVEDTVPDASAVLPNNQGDDAKFTSSPLDFEVDRAAGDNDQRHRFVASGVFATSDLAAGLGPVGRALAGSWWLSGIVTAQSGRPYSARINGDVNGDGNTRNDLAPGIRRNALRLPSLAIVDLRLARDVNFGPRVRSQLICEVFNVFNRDNIIAVTPAAYVLSGTSLTPVANFRRPMLSAGERIMQLAVRISF